LAGNLIDKEKPVATPALHPTATLASARAAVVLSAFHALFLGAFILFGVGFAQPEVLHNAAHDARHAFTFPCH
jgi:cobalt transporter subunit CbtB